MAKEKKESAAAIAAQQPDDFKYIVRIANTDMDGKYTVMAALDKIKGVGMRTGAIIADHAGVSRGLKIGTCTDEQVEALARSVEQIQTLIPTWMLNRQKDVETGEDIHFLGNDLDLKFRDDLNRLKKIRSYRGIRHETKQKVRGQRSKSNGRTGLTLGVTKKKS